MQNTPAESECSPAPEELAAVPHGWRRVWEFKDVGIASVALIGIAAHLVLRFGLSATPQIYNWPLLATLAIGGLPLVAELIYKAARGQFGSDLLAGISIVTAAILHEYLAGAIVVLMLSGGEALEAYAVAHASSVLLALARRMPSVAHRKNGAQIDDIRVDQISIDDSIIIYPHETCPVDGQVIEGHGTMDESFLTGEPFQMEKAPGVAVISGAVNGESALTIRATKKAIDSRYAKIMEVMRASESNRPKLRRIGDQLGAIYTPIALAIAGGAWAWSGDSMRFLSVLVVATPCPLLIGIPVAIIGSVSLAARRGIIIKNPVALERISRCATAIFDKTGTLTYGRPQLTAQHTAPKIDPTQALAFAATVEKYSKHPLALAILNAAREQNLSPLESEEINETPGRGLTGLVQGHRVRLTSRGKLPAEMRAELPKPSGGLECVLILDEQYAATFQFRDAPRQEGVSFIQHLGPKHAFDKLMLVSGDRESEVRYLADEVGITEVHAEQTPEQKLAIVKHETARANTLYVGDGINDAPAMLASTVPVAIGHNTDVTAAAASVVIMEGDLRRVDELLHIGKNMRNIALQTAVGGMVLSIAGMFAGAAGFLPPVAGAITQEIIDVIAVLNALRAALPPREISDF
ncbi:MAG: heavy metal translocating P-type ATPase [Limisphaerales bacterium]